MYIISPSLVYMFMFWKNQKHFPLFLKWFLWVFHLKTLTRPHSSTWEIDGFKGLVAYAKCNRDSCESELRFSFSYFLFLLGSLVCFTRGRQKSWCGGIILHFLFFLGNDTKNLLDDFECKIYAASVRLSL